MFDVVLASVAPIATRWVRLAPINGHLLDGMARLLSANNGSGRTHASQSVANALVPRCTDAEEQMSASEERLNYNK